MPDRPLIHQAHNAGREDGRLARPRACQHQRRSGTMVHGCLLSRMQRGMSRDWGSAVTRVVQDLKG